MNTSTASQKAELHRLFARRLPGKLRQLAGLIDRIVSSPSGGPIKQQLLLHIDQSVRSAESFGFTAIGQLMHSVEAAVHAGDLPSLASVQRQLLLAAEQYDGREMAVETPTAVNEAPVAKAPEPALQPIALSVSNDAERVRLTRDLALFGFAAHAPQQAKAEDVALLVDLAQLAQFSQHDKPIIALLPQDDIATRLQALRAGAKAMIVQPIEISAIMQALEMVAPTAVSEPIRVLIVDDSRSQSTFYNKALSTAGCITRVVNQPLNIASALVELQPELILLDMQMPECSGLELARVLRQMPAYVNTPIVFLSAEENPEKQAAAMAVSGDDFLIKPVAADALLHAVVTRVSRARRLQQAMARDGLTQALALSAFLTELDNRNSLARRDNEVLSLAIIDIDGLRRYNEKHSYADGDRLLQRLSRLLTTRMRQTDTIGRLSGDSFGILMPGCHRDDAKRLMENVKRDFGELETTASLSIGIACHQDGSADALRERAQHALREAKTHGGNRCVLAD